jgi:hypothetical protein
MVTRTVRSNATKKIKTKEKTIMQTSISTPKRRLRSYREIVGNNRYQPRKHLTRCESSNQPDAATDLQYFVAALPKNASQSEKSKLLEELANAIGNITTSDVFVISMWIG